MSHGKLRNLPKFRHVCEEHSARAITPAVSEPPDRPLHEVRPCQRAVAAIGIAVSNLRNGGTSGFAFGGDHTSTRILGTTKNTEDSALGIYPLAVQHAF